MAVTRAVRRGGVLIVGVLALALLASCTPGTPEDYGIRLNADGTIDFVDCNGIQGHVVVRFSDEEITANDDTLPIQWDVRRTASGRLYDVIHYGETPAESETVRLEPPPPDWVWVSFGGGRYSPGYTEQRSELVEGEWVWRNDEVWSFVPEHACAEVD